MFSRLKMWLSRPTLQSGLCAGRWYLAGLAALVLLLLASPALDAQGNNKTFCWQQNYTRTPNGVSSTCPSGYQKQGDLCYPSCPPGYAGAGPVCWQSCPYGFTDTGAFCQKNGNMTSAGYPWKPGDPDRDYTPAGERCALYNPQGCNMSGLIWYPNCLPGYEELNKDAGVCTPVCPSGMADTGVDCVKNSKPRGAGEVPGCGSGLDNDAGLCYPSCTSGFNGVGPVCWGSCPSGWVSCGAACAINQSACNAAVGNFVLDTSAVALNILGFAFGGSAGTSAIEDAVKAGESAAMEQVLTHTSTNWVSMTLGVGKEYALAYGKQFVKTTLKNKLDGAFDERNMFWNFLKQMNSDSLQAINDSTNQYAKAQTAPSTSPFNMGALITAAGAIDPTGIANLVTTFTQYGPCTEGNDFSLSAEELFFADSSTQSFTLTAKQPMTITRLATPAFTNMTVTPQSSCIGKPLSIGEACDISVTVNGSAKLDSELRIYTNDYQTVPYPVHLVANRSSRMQTTFIPGQEALTLSSMQGAWLENNGDVFDIDATGDLTGTTLTVSSPQTRTILLNGTQYVVDDTAEHFMVQPALRPSYLTNVNSGLVLGATGPGLQLEQGPNREDGTQQFTFTPVGDGSYTIAASNGMVLNIAGSSTSDNAAVILWPPQSGSAPNQNFLVQPLPDGNFRLVNMNSGEVVSLPNDSKASGATVVQTTWTGDLSQEFSLSGASNAALFSKLPWDQGCAAGQTSYDGLCYNVTPGWAMTSPGIQGKVCPADWRDDGTTCWPPWTGVAVASQADPNGNYNMRHPIVVTSCTSYAASQNQACPANFQNIGGSGSCSCQPITTSKDITSIIGTPVSQ